MKRIYSIIIVLIMVGINFTYAGLWPSVKNPTSPDASLIALEFSIDNRGILTSFSNANWSLIVPLVKMEDGTFVDFKMIATLADVGTIYYKENLKAGKYTLIGFRHVYTDYDKLQEYKDKEGIKDDDIYLIPKEAFDDLSYRVKQQYDLEKPVEFTLEPNKMMTLGHYVFKYLKGNGGAKGTTNDRYEITRAEIMMADPEDQSLLSYMKQWKTKKWKIWNEKNPAEIAE